MARGRRKRNEDDDDNGFAAWGGYMAAKKSKLMEQFSEAAELETNKISNIFKGISIFVNGYTKPSAEELKNLMTLHGGVYHHYHIPVKTTHIIASNLPDTKIKQLGWNNKIIKPDWITDSINANKLLDYSNYLLYTHHNRLQPKLNFPKLKKHGSKTDSICEKQIENGNKISENNNPCHSTNYNNNNNNNNNNTDSEDIEESFTKNNKRIAPEIVISSEKEETVTKDIEEPFSPDLFSDDDNVVENKFEDKDITSKQEQIGDKKEDNNKEIIKIKKIEEINKVEKCNNTKINNIEENVKPSDSVSENKGKSSRTLNATNPKFLSEFYNNSRLHHISTLGAMFKQHICNLREQTSGKFPEREKLRQHIFTQFEKNVSLSQGISSNDVIIMHIDMDCFFVSVGLRKYPELKGHPVAVTHSKGGQEPGQRSGVDRQAEIDIYRKRIQEAAKLKTNPVNNQAGPASVLSRLEGLENSSMSEIASCSYEARQAGVKNGMFMGQALKLCPNLKTIPYDFEGYKEVANTLYNTIAEYTLNIEAVSCDEMFVDISEVLQDTGATVEQWASYIRRLIQDRTQCPCSTGFGANRLQARMATRTAKPNGQFHLLPDDVQEYMVYIKVGDLPGVGRSTTLKLNSMEIKTCGDLQLLNLKKLQDEFGSKIGETLYKHCRGIDERPLVYEHERKSVSAEVNYGIRFKDNMEADNFFRQLCEEVHSRLTEIKMKGKCITLKLMVRSKDAPAESSKFMGHGVCDYITKSTTLSSATADLEIIVREILSISKRLNVPPTELRGIGIQISRLEKQNKIASSNVLTNFLKGNSSDTKTKEQQRVKTSKSTGTSNSPQHKNETINKNKSFINTEKSLVDKSVSTSPPKEKKSPIRTISETTKRCLLQNIFKTVDHSKPSTSLGRTVRDRELSPVSEVAEFLAKEARDKTGVDKGTSIEQGNVKEKKRGRPKGIAKSFGKKGTATGKRNNGNLDGFFKNQKQHQYHKELLPPPATQPQIVAADIDLSVLAELPEDIQAEILKEYQLQKTENGLINSPEKQCPIVEEFNDIPCKKQIFNPKQIAKVSPNHSVTQTDFDIQFPESQFDENNPVRIVTESSNEIKLQIKNEVTQQEKDTIDKLEQMFLQMTLEQIRHSLRVWVENVRVPQEYDIELLSVYFRKLALDSKIDDLFLMLKFFYNQISNSKNCNWHRAYFEVHHVSQEAMKEKYGSQIWAHKEFKCKYTCHLPLT